MIEYTYVCHPPHPPPPAVLFIYLFFAVQLKVDLSHHAGCSLISEHIWIRIAISMFTFILFVDWARAMLQIRSNWFQRTNTFSGCAVGVVDCYLLDFPQDGANKTLVVLFLCPLFLKNPLQANFVWNIWKDRRFIMQFQC